MTIIKELQSVFLQWLVQHGVHPLVPFALISMTAGAALTVFVLECRKEYIRQQKQKETLQALKRLQENVQRYAEASKHVGSAMNEVLVSLQKLKQENQPPKRWTHLAKFSKRFRIRKKYRDKINDFERDD